MDFKDYYKILESVLKEQSPEEVLDNIKVSGLRGRGGAGFPMGFKLESAKNTPSDTRFIVCNADEGDPGAFSDRYIMEERPHSLLLGMILTGYATNAEWGVFYIRAEYPESVTIIEVESTHAVTKFLFFRNLYTVCKAKYSPKLRTLSSVFGVSSCVRAILFIIFSNLSFPLES